MPYSPRNLKNLKLNVRGETYHFFQTLDRRWFCKHNGQIRKTSGSYVNNMIWMFGDKAQRLQEQLERQQLFQRLEQKRQRQGQRQQLELFF